MPNDKPNQERRAQPERQVPQVPALVTRPGAATTADPGVGTLPAPPAAPVLPAPARADEDARALLDASRQAATDAVLDAAEGKPLKAGQRRTVTGADSAIVVVRKPDGTINYTAVVNRGQDVPADASDAELDRLAGLGVFELPAPARAPQTEAERQAVRLRARG